MKAYFFNNHRHGAWPAADFHLKSASISGVASHRRRRLTD